MLKIAPSITLLHAEQEKVNERKNLLVQGYQITQLVEGPNQFRVTVNCDHSLFIDCLHFLLEQMPEPFITLMGQYGQIEQLDGLYSVSDVTSLIKHKENFIKDCINLEMAFDFLDETFAQQLFVSDCKFFEIYTDHLDFLHQLTAQFGIKECDDMAIITEFPRVMKSDTSDKVIQEINQMIDYLYAK